MQVKLEVVGSAAGAKVVVDGNMEDAQEVANGASIVVSGSVVDVRELGIGAPVADHPGEASGE